MRFYQTLSAGRIPILIDSDIIFPFENEIDWYPIIIIGKDENDLINKILDLWKNKNIEEIQIKCKEVYDKFFDKSVFFNKVFSDIIDNKDVVDTKIYSLYNDLQYMSENELINHYIQYGKQENRLIKLPENFNINLYKKKNNDLLLFNNDQLLQHFVNHGYNENRKY